MELAIWITVAFVCIGLCAYGIRALVLRAEARGREDALARR